MKRSVIILLVVLSSSYAFGTEREGYYRFPAIHGDKIVFTAEGDLWIVGASGGSAIRLTTNHGTESYAAISPDGKTIAFSAQYEGPTEVYTMSIDGGLPVRRTYEGGTALVAGWTPDGKVIYSTSYFSTLPNRQLATLDLATGERNLIPLAQASEGVFTQSGDTLYFTRLPFQGSHTKRYAGGTAQNIWRYIKGQDEATPITSDYPGTSKNPVLWNGRVYFVSDRDGTMNIWSMTGDGDNVRQETFHKGFDVSTPSLDGGRIVYHDGADLYLYDIATKHDSQLQIALSSDFDQEVTKWVKKPMDYLTADHISADGEKIVLTARGEVFVVPVNEGRLVEVTRKSGVRYSNARFTPDGKSVVLQSEESGEIEFWKYPSNGVGEGVQLSNQGRGYRNEGIPSPDGKMLAYTEKDDRLVIYDLESKKQTVVGTSEYGGYSDLTWSPDSKWLAYSGPAANLYSQLVVYDVEAAANHTLTDDRVDSYNPAWSPDGKWMYFLSERTFQSSVYSPWGSREPEPFYDKTTKIYGIALAKDEKFPFTPPNELQSGEQGKSKDDQNDKSKEEKTVQVKIDFDGIGSRVQEVPVPAGDYFNLSVNGKDLFVAEHPSGIGSKTKLEAVEIKDKDVLAKTLVDDIESYELSGDGKKIELRKDGGIYVIDASSSPPSEISKASVNLASWTFSFNPKEEWRQMFVDAWRLERDFFYDPHLQGVNYDSTLNRYLPLVDRVTDRDELNDLIGQIVAELSALHTFVVGGDIRTATDQISIGSLGALVTRDDKSGGYMVEHIYRPDPDYLDVLSPLAKPGVNIADGDVILSVNGTNTLSVPSMQMLLEGKVGQQVLLHVRSSASGKEIDAIVVPISQSAASNLKYSDWENSRRMIVEKESEGHIGYVHLRAMGGGNFTEWVKGFYPVFNRDGLIVDVRNNQGGNIDSWILEKLMRKAWMYWKPRTGKPSWNMQYAFRGHIIVLCNEFTASDGEAFTEGFKRLGLGKVIGTRTWGGEIWLSFDNWLRDKGIASAAETGVYGPEGKWLIEGHGVDPDLVVDNGPYQTFQGKDAQLEAAINYLRKEIQEQPVPVPPPPQYPDKAVKY